MYADPSPYPSDHLIVADGNWTPINVKKLTGLSFLVNVPFWVAWLTRRPAMWKALR